MFARFMPKEGKFFDLFNAHAEQMVLGGQALVSLISAFGKSSTEIQTYSKSIDAIETEADKITHQTISLLHSTFITPLDRDEIHQLITGMDDVLDVIQDVAECMELYDIQSITPETRQLADISLTCIRQVKSVVNLLENMDNAQSMLQLCREIDQLEADADRVMREAMSRLFRDESDVKQVLKMKAVYELLESVSDRCADVANTVEGIVLENA